MNLFTRFLTRKNNSDDLQTFVSHWDQLEILVITVFKSKQVSAEDITTWRRVRPWLVENYGKWEADLAKLWPQTLVGGQPAPEDPFRRLFRAEQAADFLGDWVAMQNLAAAREALNQLVIQHGKK